MTIYIIIGILAVAVLGYFLFRKNERRPRPEPKEPEPDLGDSLEQMHIKMAAFEADEKPYGVRIVQDQHFVSFKEMVNDIPQLPDGGTFSPALEDLEMNGPGLYETNYNHGGIIWHLFLLVIQNKEKPDVSDDDTKWVRKQIASNNHIFFDGTFYTHGMLPEDLSRNYEPYGYIGDVGAGKIIPIEDRENLSIKGGKFFNLKEVFTPETRPTRDNRNVSENTFLNLVRCRNISVTDLEYTGPHDTLRDTGFPQFYGSKEFEHFLDIKECQNVFLKGLKVNNVYGDFVYFRRSYNSHITIIDCEVYFNGRQGVAWGDGDNIYIDNLRVELSGRGGADFEPPTEGHEVHNVIIRNSHFKTWLLPFPMGGRGVVENVLIENNTTETSSSHTSVLGDRVSSIRRNIIFRGNRSLWGFGSRRAKYGFTGAENVLIENEYGSISPNRSREIIYLGNCRNVTIRNNDFPNAKYIVLSDTPIEEVKVYGNVQQSDLQFKIYSYEMPWIDPPYVFAEKYKDPRDGEVDFIKWKGDYNDWTDYMAKRAETRTISYVPVEEYDVEEYGEPDVPRDPDFTPYWGE